MRRVLLALAMSALCALPVSADTPAETTVRSFHLAHRTPAEASQLVQELLSAEGSLTVHPGKAMVTVQDTAGVIREVGEALRSFDRPLRPFRLTVELWEASNDPPATAKAKVQVDARVRRLFRYRSYHKLAETTVESEGSGSLALELGPDYVVRLPSARWRIVGMGRSVARRQEPRPAAGGGRPAQAPRRTAVSPETAVRKLLKRERVVLDELSFNRRKKAKGSQTELQQILRTSLILSERQRIVLGATQSEGGRRALILIFELGGSVMAEGR